MSDVKFSKEHEWITLEGDIATIGITKHATEMLGDIVFVELPEKEASVEKDGTAGVVESTKAASDVYTPISGEVVDTNQSIVDDPSKINEDPEGLAWFFKLKIKNKAELDSLMNKEEYDKFANLSYSSLFIRLSNSALFFIFSLKNHAKPSGSSLIFEGSSTID